MNFKAGQLKLRSQRNRPIKKDEEKGTETKALMEHHQAYQYTHVSQKSKINREERKIEEILIMANNFPNLLKYMSLHIQKSN